jgi:hypothetical protein
VLENVNFQANSDGFIFDQEIITQIIECRFRIQEVPVPVRYFPEASSASLRASLGYGLEILYLLLRYDLHRRGLWRSNHFVSLKARYHQV